MVWVSAPVWRRILGKAFHLSLCVHARSGPMSELVPGCIVVACVFEYRIGSSTMMAARAVCSPGQDLSWY